MRSRAFFIALILLILQAHTVLADEITITYRKTEAGYSYGEGVFISSQAGEFYFKPGDVIPFAYNGVTVLGREGDAVLLKGDNFVYSFLAPRPSGHGYYTLSFTLPETQPEKHIEIRIEGGERLIRSNVDFSVEKDGNFLVLRATTSESHIEISFITELAYMIFSSILAAAIFAMFLLLFTILKRRDIRQNIRKYLSFTMERVKPYLEVREEGERLNLYFTSPRLKNAFSVFGREGGRLRVSIPYWVISVSVLAFLIVVFFNSILSPLEKVLPMLGPLKTTFIIVITIAAVVLSLLSILFLLSARDERGLIVRFGVIGGGVVGIITAYLGVIALFLAVTTAALIYFLSVLILEEEDEEMQEEG